ncbi:sensor histidine kinase [Saccharothrix yanglingensis]|uniref:histidine kinase n=1 Tax=Saccharothrix yanglingensis TaxID=659496 RepID=A0ABU0X8D7_9PSEU|nr:histidine kinase [Saccharothrix yanglingensis]MDQ2586879.1 hypothetical protein [Saccharothrix yanglingensis]
MPGIRRVPPAQLFTTLVVGTVALVALVVEVCSAERVPGGVGLAVCGVLPALALSRTRFVTPAALVSVAFTVVAHQVPVGLDNTFGVVELAAFSWLVVRVVMLRPVRHLLWQVPLLTVAAAVLPVRLDTDNRAFVPDLVGLIGFGMLFMVLLGLYLRLHERRRADLHALAKQEQRLEYARDLHDFVAHHVTAIVAQARAVRYTTAAGMPPSPEALDAMLEAIEKTGSQALASMRGMITVLRDERSPEERRLLADVLGEAVRDFPGPPRAVASVSDDLRGARPPAHVLDAVRHVVQESLTNVLRHAADVTRVRVDARLDDGELEVSVTNDGRVADVPVLSGGGFGLVGLAERVEAVGGTLSAGPSGAGWRVTARLPSSLA